MPTAGHPARANSLEGTLPPQQPCCPHHKPEPPQHPWAPSSSHVQAPRLGEGRHRRSEGMRWVRSTSQALLLSRGGSWGRFPAGQAAGADSAPRGSGQAHGDTSEQGQAGSELSQLPCSKETTTTTTTSGFKSSLGERPDKLNVPRLCHLF